MKQTITFFMHFCSDAIVFSEWNEWSTCTETCSPRQTIRDRTCLGGCSKIVDSDLKDAIDLVLEYIEIQPTELVWSDDGTGADREGTFWTATAQQLRLVFNVSSWSLIWSS